MKQSLIGLLFLLFVCSAVGQSPLPPPYIVSSDTALSLRLPAKNWQVMADPSGKMTLQQVMQSGNFQDKNRKVDYSLNTYWLRFRVKNGMQKEARIALPQVAAVADIYAKTDTGNWLHKTTGTDVSWSLRNGLKLVPASTLTIPVGQSVLIYKRIQWDFVAAQPDTMAVYVAFTDQLVQQDYINGDAYLMTGIQNAFLMGMVILSIIINFYFFLVVREKEFVWFCIFGILFFLVSLSSLNDVFLREHPRFLLYLYIFSRSFIVYAMIHFVRTFLKTKTRFRYWDRFLVIYSYVFVVGLLATFFASSLLKINVAHAAHTTENVLNLIYGIAMLATLFAYIRNRDKSKRLLVFALLPVMLLNVLTYAAAVINHLYYPRFGAPDVSGYTSPFNKAAFFILILCYLWMMILFTWVLFLRFTGLRKELEQQRTLDNVKTRFFANISHEFRTPLTLIKGPIEDFLRDNDVEKFKEVLPDVHRNSNRLLQLINQLLDLSRLGAGNYHLNTSREDIIPFVKQIVHSFSSLAHKKNIQLETEVDPRLRNDLRNEVISFYFDDDILEKIFSNLLSNAFKFTQEGGSIIVSLTLPESERGFLELKVEDNGIGIAADKLPFIFDRFYQVDDAASGLFEGSGIGLSLVKELVELHGGKIKAISQPGQVTAFSCFLPLNKKVTSPGKDVNTSNSVSARVLMEEAPVRVNEYENSARDGAPVVLLADDQQDVRKYISNKLSSDYRVVEAKDGKEGLAMAKELMPDIVISDVMMPEMDGFELCALLKTDNVTSHIPVILLTARAEETDKISGLETGADAYLIKPFNADELRIRVHNLIEIRNKMRAKFSDKLIVKPSEIAVTPRDRAFMQELLAVAERHLDDDVFSVERLAQEVHMSTSQINRKLKALINQSAQQFIRSVRMQRAMELLKNDAATVAEVAYEVGFSDPGYFAKVFKAHFGLQPSEVKGE